MVQGGQLTLLEDRHPSPEDLHGVSPYIYIEMADPYRICHHATPIIDLIWVINEQKGLAQNESFPSYHKYCRVRLPYLTTLDEFRQTISFMEATILGIYKNPHEKNYY